jgi:2-polyprenyl-3-methyl-5-hydroxy-6-metoxy-1,4-benzoquinol methylase
VETEHSAAELKYDVFNDSPGSTHQLVVSLVPEGARVLEFGCATGYMSEVLKLRLGCVVTGVELEPDAAAVASTRADRVIVGDAEVLDLDELLDDEEFDAVLFADVLEHLKDPGALLRRIRPFIAPGGVVVASIPNVAHGSLRLALLQGEFRYRQTGLLDGTHLRFFTRASIQDLFEEAGYVVTNWQRQRVDIDAAEIALPPGGVPAHVQASLAGDPEATTYQFILRAVTSDEASRLLALRRELEEAGERSKELRAEIAELRAEHAAELARAQQRAQDEVEKLEAVRTERDERLLELAAVQKELDTLRRAHEALGRRLAAERVAMTDTVSALERNLDILHHSRSFRYTAPVRSALGIFRRR